MKSTQYLLHVVSSQINKSFLLKFLHDYKIVNICFIFTWKMHYFQIIT